MSITRIEWCDHTVNPLTVEGGGWYCTKISTGCINCYAEAMNIRVGNHRRYNIRNVDYIVDLSQFDKLPKKKPCRVFLQSMSDIFHQEVGFSQQLQIFTKARLLPHHQFIVLTKRTSSALDFLYDGMKLPQNCHIGFSAEDQDNYNLRNKYAQGWSQRVPIISFEPLLSGINLALGHRRMSWAIIGCESGPKRRPCALEWVRGIVNQCKHSNIPVFVKQLDIDGKVSKNMDEWPEDLRIREYPKELQL